MGDKDIASELAQLRIELAKKNKIIQKRDEDIKKRDENIQKLRETKQELKEHNRELREYKRELQEDKRKAEEGSRKTTLPEALSASHTCYYQGRNVGTDNQSITGIPDNASLKKRPDRICLWEDYAQEQESNWAQLSTSDFFSQRLFTSRDAFKDNGRDICHQPIRTQFDLFYVMNRTVEDLVAWAVNQMHKDDTLKRRYNIQGLRHLKDVPFGQFIEPTPQDTHEDRICRKVAAIITQCFRDIIHGRVQYGCVATPEVFVLLKVPESDPGSVYYYIADPMTATDSSPEGIVDSLEDHIHETSVGQMLGLTLLALRSSPRSHAWLNASLSQLSDWQIEPAILKGPEPRQDAPEIAYKPSRDAAASAYHRMSLIKPRPRTAPATYSSFNKSPYIGQNDENSSEEYGQSLIPAQSRDAPGAANISSSSGGKANTGSSSDTTINAGSSSRHQIQYCTQVCLLGLVRGVVAKCTWSKLIHDLECEATVYRHLQSIQGEHMPVYLGSIDLETPYYCMGIPLVHMLVLSFGGDSISRHIHPDNKIMHKSLADASAKAIHRLGVLHDDLSPRNILWNEQTKSVVIIDFERAQIVDAAANDTSPTITSPQFTEERESMGWKLDHLAHRL
ncbi:hypothetical protein K491DRAFT_763783 [Lophiostoma macrostomum CBS 122681]|uniref:Aminoglycoside phosphotransferase domain-containing protein n=1 Tax=Lophiostoma macrostomum CBS 122681 TaxID=1314788 RepID=A0A6A6SLM4_9PLEO|nr:hypothetical protein K491DRAFT_763783 [Lophiostoma macrostomum CBS 122681]